ncbi:phage neck terminator protein, partial [Providencia stuartii]|uniref:phage neck terminator protein n=1 Tax=Providencia stuartii TaxID=588 RepID=UPI001C5C9841
SYRVLSNVGEGAAMATISITERDIFVELRKYLIELFDCPVVQGYQNNTPVPENGIVMHMLFEHDLDYTAEYWDAIQEEVTAQRSVKATFQLDFYGVEANNRSRVVANLWKSSYTTDRLVKCQPLDSGQPRKDILVNESNQYENRMMLEITLQYNPETSYHVDGVDEISITSTNI